MVGRPVGFNGLAVIMLYCHMRAVALARRTALVRSSPRTLARSVSTDAPTEEVDVAIVGGGMGGAALALALAQNNRMPPAAGVRCALCGALCSSTHDGRRHAAGSEAMLSRRMQEHHERQHRDLHAFGDCFPASPRPSRPSRPLTFTVFEKDANLHVRRQGYGLTMQQGSGALERLGLLEAARAEDTPSNAHYIFDGAGRLVHVYSSKAFGSAGSRRETAPWERHRNVTIPRQRCRELILERLASHEPGAMAWGWQYAGHSRLPDGRLAVQLESDAEAAGERRRRAVVARVLVGADGVWSGVRRKPICGSCCWRASSSYCSC